MTARPGVVRQSKEDGSLSRCSWDRAIHAIEDAYADPEIALEGTTPQTPAESLFAYYWEATS